MAGIIYALCTITSALGAYLLLRGYMRKKARLLLWSGLCFVGLSLNNMLLMVDRSLGSLADLSTIRIIPAVLGMMLLLYGLIWENE